MSQWYFTDPSNVDAVTGDPETWIFPLNPKRMTSPHVQHETTLTPNSAIDGSTRTWRKPPKPYEWQFEGSVRTRAHYDTLLEWFARCRRLHVTDHFSRTWDIQIVSVDMTPLHTSRTVEWRYSYVVKTFMYGRIS